MVTKYDQLFSILTSLALELQRGKYGKGDDIDIEKFASDWEATKEDVDLVVSKMEGDDHGNG